jgi:hypothetical protein
MASIEKPEDVTDKPNEQTQSPAHTDGGETTTTIGAEAKPVEAKPAEAKPAEAKPATEEEDDSDFEDLDGGFYFYFFLNLNHK